MASMPRGGSVSVILCITGTSLLPKSEGLEELFFSHIMHFTLEASFQPGYMRNVMILTPTLSIFHSFPVTYHLALLMMCTFHSSLDMHSAAHAKVNSDIATSAWLIDFCHKVT